MLKLNSKDVNYSICQFEYIKVNSRVVLRFTLPDSMIFDVMLEEREQLIWNLLIATDRGNCSISDIVIAQCLSRKFEISILQITETVKFVRNTINMFIKRKMIKIHTG